MSRRSGMSTRSSGMVPQRPPGPQTTPGIRARWWKWAASVPRRLRHVAPREVTIRPTPDTPPPVERAIAWKPEPASRLDSAG